MKYLKLKSLGFLILSILLGTILQSCDKCDDDNYSQQERQAVQQGTTGTVNK